jgi:Uma2 family endonuclease
MPLLVLSSVSDEDLLALSRRNPGLKLERTAEGRLRVSPTGGESGRVSAEVLGQLYRWNEEKGLGVVFDAATGFRLPDGAVFSPDAAFAP